MLRKQEEKGREGRGEGVGQAVIDIWNLLNAEEARSERQGREGGLCKLCIYWYS